MKKPYVQFSKRVVVAVNIIVPFLCLIGIVLCWNGGDLDALSNVINTYIRFAMVVFASYSCNSVADKVITSNQMNKIFGGKSDTYDQDETNG